MNKYILLTKEPTKDDYFRAKVYDIPFAVESSADIFRFNLIDLSIDTPFEINFEQCEKEGGAGHIQIMFSNIKFKHNIKIAYKNTVGNYFPVYNIWMDEDDIHADYKDISKKVEELVLKAS